MQHSLGSASFFYKSASSVIAHFSVPPVRSRQAIASEASDLILLFSLALQAGDYGAYELEWSRLISCTNEKGLKISGVLGEKGAGFGAVETQ